jgi:TolA-binding protein
MTSRRHFRDVAARGGLILCVTSGAVLAGQALSPEEQARRWYASGLRFIQEGKPAEGLKDLQKIADAYPTTTVADNALLEIARYHFEGAGDLAAAEGALNTLLQRYPQADATPFGLVMAGRLILARGHGPAELESAIANFERVRTLFPRSDGVPLALFYIGETERERRRLPEALRAYTQVATDYPRSPWSARSQLGAAFCLVQMGRPVDALEGLQRLRLRFPDAPQAVQARAWNSILYRLYVRVPAEPPYVVGARTLAGGDGKLDTVQGLTTHDLDQVTVLLRSAALRFDASGKIVWRTSLADGRAVSTDRQDQPVITTNRSLVTAGGVLSLGTPKPDGSLKMLDDLRAAVVGPTGQYLVADRSSRAILRFQPDGRHIGTFASFDAERLAINGVGDLAALDRGNKTVAIFDRDGQAIGRIPTRGQGYELRNPVDLAWDPLAHLYLLDRDTGTVHVFGSDSKPRAQFMVAERLPGSFRRGTAIGVDEAGRLYIYDQRAQHVRVYE